MRRRKFIQSASLGAASLASLGLNDFDDSHRRRKGLFIWVDFVPQLKDPKGGLYWLGVSRERPFTQFCFARGTEVVGFVTVSRPRRRKVSDPKKTETPASRARC